MVNWFDCLLHVTISAVVPRTHAHAHTHIHATVLHEDHGRRKDQAVSSNILSNSIGSIRIRSDQIASPHFLPLQCRAHSTISYKVCYNFLIWQFLWEKQLEYRFFDKCNHNMDIYIYIILSFVFCLISWIYCYEKKLLFQFLIFILRDAHVEKNNIIIMLIYILYYLITRYYFLT